jgi:hypothetical protein
MNEAWTMTLRQRRERVLAWLLTLRDEAGGAVTEVAFMMALLGVPLMTGIIYLGTLQHYSIEISNASHAAVMYGMRSSTYASNTSGMTTAARNEASDFGASLTVTPTSYYACSTSEGGTTYTTAAAATTACTLGHSLQFVKVVASGTVTPPGKLAGFAGTVTLSSTSIMEVQE